MANEETTEQRQHEMREKIKDFAKAKADRVYLDHFRKSKLAILMKGCQSEYDTAAMQEREARRHPDYLEVLNGLREAIEIEERLRWELKMKEMEFEAWRTRQANQRSEKQRY